MHVLSARLLPFFAVLVLAACAITAAVLTFLTLGRDAALAAAE